MQVLRLARNERGIALITVLFVALVVAAVSVGAAMVTTNANLIQRYSSRLSLLEAAADAGIEEARSRVNADNSLYPANGFTTLENGVNITDADGATIPNVRRWLYVGPTGITTGQYGVFGSVVSVTEDPAGNRVVRRGEIVQQSFAKYAYFTNVEGNIWFGAGDQLWGPVHSNDRIQIHNTGATFHSTVETAEDVYLPGNGDFRQGYEEGVPVIPMPQTADLLALEVQGQAGNTSFDGNFNGTAGQATTRIEFVAADLNGDGDVTDDNEGFIKVYQSLNNAAWVSGDVPSNYGSAGLRDALTCGDWHGGQFITTDQHGNNTSAPFAFGDHSWLDAMLNGPSRACLLGGNDLLNNPDAFIPNDGTGQWLQWPGAVSPLVVAARAVQGDAAYLFPITRALNPSFKGVIFVDGNVGISGVLRGQVTVASTGDIVILDDMTYATDPGAGTCNDILGIFADDDVVVADNAINPPVRRKSPGSSSNQYLTYDETTGEFIHGVMLALGSFTAENYNSGSDSDQPCEGTPAGRGCLYLTGGVIQEQRGAVGLASGYGYVKRYSYDQCAATNSPPYFPTTGYFERGRYYEIDPANFDVAALYALLTP